MSIIIECPYCGREFPAEDEIDRKRWQRHMYRCPKRPADLQETGK